MQGRTPGQPAGTIYTRFIHPLLSIVSPFCLLVALDALLGDLFWDLPVLPAWFFLLLLVVGSLKTMLNNIFFRERISPFNTFRELVLLLSLAWLLFSLFRTGPWKQRFLPGSTNFYPTLLVLLQWLLTFRLHRLFRRREMFAACIRDKAGERLLSELRQASGLGTATYQDMLRINNQLLAQGFVLFLILGIVAVAGGEPGPRSLSWMGIFMLVTFLSVTAINQFKQEYIDLREGINAPSRSQRHRIYFALFFIAGCILLAFALAGRTPLLELPEWGSSKSLDPPAPREDFQPLATRRPDDLLLDLEPEVMPLPRFLLDFADMVGRLLKLLLVVAACLLILLPFFSRDFQRWLKKRSFYRFLQEKLRDLMAFFGRIFRDLLEFFESLFIKRQLQKLARRQAGQEEQELSRKRAGLRKRLQTGTVIRLFVRLIQWGGRHGCRYYFSQTAVEYIRQLGTRYPEMASDLGWTVAVFEQALFSPYLLAGEQLRQYRRHIREITRTP